MKMIFFADEVVSVNSFGCEPRHVKKRDIADHLTKNGKPENCLENAVILSHIPMVRSICLTEANNIIRLYPMYVCMSVSDELFEFLYDFLVSN